MRQSEKELLEYLQMFAEDVMDSLRRIKDEDTQINRRNYVRALFAFVEGFTNHVKEILREITDEPEFSPIVTFGEKVLLDDVHFELDNKGMVASKTRYQPTAANFLFVYKISSRFVNPEYVIDTSNSKWSSFLGAIKIRNRLTHPKTIKDMVVTDNDFEVLGEAEEWFREISNKTVFKKNEI